MTRAILHDVARCTGCFKCVEMCTRENDLVDPEEVVRFAPQPLSAERFTTLESVGNDALVRSHCLHCLEPSCAAACLVGALHQTPEGPVVYDSDKCIGCRYCMLACPFHAVRYEWDTTFPLVKKCDMCFDRPGGPACVEACPHDATMYGERDELLAIARDRIAKEPGRYLPKIWGEKAFGGTGVLFISHVSLDERWPVGAGEESIPDLTWPLAKKTPFLAFGVMGFLVGTRWILGRRNKLAEERAAAQAPDAGATGENEDTRMEGSEQ